MSAGAIVCDFPENDEMVLQAISTFQTHYGSSPEIISFAPGRVNLIGEHTV